MADLLLRLRESRWAICVGVYKDELVLSLRTRGRRPTAGQVAEAIVGTQGTAGGHGTMAGGQVPLRGADPEQLAGELVQRVLRMLKVPADAPSRRLL